MSVTDVRIKLSLEGDDQVSSGLSKVGSSAEQADSRVGKLAKVGLKGLQGAAVGTAAVITGTLATSLTKGFSRLNNIEQAEAKLRGLGNSADDVAEIMVSANEAVSGTAYGLDAAATVAASAVAAGIAPGEELTRTLKMTGDAATIAGTDMATMGSIVNKVATSDMMQMDVANQLMDAGIPILQMVAEEMGVTAEEARKLASDGKISFETFQTAMENGLGGAALESGATFSGAMDNLGAALGRIGATALTPFFDLSKDGLGAMTEVANDVNAALGPVMEEFASWLTSSGVPAIKDFGESIKDLGSAIQESARFNALTNMLEDMFSAGQAVAPVMVEIGTSLAQAGAAIGISTWDLLVLALQTTATVTQALVGPMETVSGFLADHPGLVTAGVAAWMGVKTIPSILGRVTGALSPVTGGLKTFALHTSESTRMAKWMNPELSTMGARFVGLESQVRRSVGAMGGMRGALSSVMGIFGGPWGVALAAAGAGIAAFASSKNRAENALLTYGESVSNSGEIVNRFNAAVGEANGTVSSQARVIGVEFVDNALAGAQAIEEMRKGFDLFNSTPPADLSPFTEEIYAAAEAIYYADDAGVATGQSIGQLERVYQGLTDQVGDAYGELEEYLEGTGRSMDDLSAIIAQGGPEFERLKDHMISLGDGGELLAGELDRISAEMEQMERDATRLDPALSAASAAIDILADSSSSADDKLSALNTVLQSMGLAPKDAEMAMRDAAEAIDEIVEAASKTEVPLAGMGEGLLVAAEASDYSHEGWRELSGTLQEMAADLQNVAVNGGDLAGTFESQGEALDALAEQYGISREEIDNLATSMGLVPDEIATIVAMQGAEEASKELYTLWTQMHDMPKGTTVEVTSLTDDAREALENIGFKLEDIPGSKNTNVTANTEEATGALDTVMSQMTVIDGINVQPTVLLNTEPLKGSAENATGILRALDIREPTPQANLVIEKLLSGVDISQGELDFLASQSPTPVADLDKSLLDTEVKLSNDMLTALGNRRDTSTVSADGSSARAEVDSVNRYLNTLQDKTVNIYTNHWTRNLDHGVQHTGGMQHGGRYLPGYAGGDRHPGYRLASSGPGTNTTDGFLAFDRMGQPSARLDAGEWVINGRSSEEFDPLLAGVNARTPRARAALDIYKSLPGYQGGSRHGIAATTTSSVASILSGSVTGFSPGAMQNLIEQIRMLAESYEVVSQELSAAFQGDDWGYGELASHIGQDATRTLMSFTSAMGEEYREATSSGQALMDGLWQGMERGSHQLRYNTRQWATGFIRDTKDVFGIASPSKVFRDTIGKNLMVGMSDGIETNTFQVTGALYRMFGEINPVLMEGEEGARHIFDRRAWTLNKIKETADELSGLFGALTGLANLIPGGGAVAGGLGLAGMLTGGLGPLMDIGSNIAKGIGQGLNLNSIVGAVTSFGSGLLGMFNNVFRIFSPSRVMRDQIGINLARGLMDGLQDKDILDTGIKRYANDLTATMPVAMESTLGRNGPAVGTSLANSVPASHAPMQGQGRSQGVVTGPLIHVENMQVRNDQDIRKLSTQLNTDINRELRAQGVLQ